MKRQTDPDVLLLQAAADPTRLAILRQLRLAEVCACDFAACCDVSQPTVSHHLGSCAKPAGSRASGAGPGSGTRSGPRRSTRFRELAGGFGPAIGLPPASRVCRSSRREPGSGLAFERLKVYVRHEDR